MLRPGRSAQHGDVRLVRVAAEGVEERDVVVALEEEPLVVDDELEVVGVEEHQRSRVGQRQLAGAHLRERVVVDGRVEREVDRFAGDRGQIDRVRDLRRDASPRPALIRGPRSLVDRREEVAVARDDARRRTDIASRAVGLDVVPRDGDGFEQVRRVRRASSTSVRPSVLCARAGRLGEDRAGVADELEAVRSRPDRGSSRRSCRARHSRTRAPHRGRPRPRRPDGRATRSPSPAIGIPVIHRNASSWWIACSIRTPPPACSHVARHFRFEKYALGRNQFVERRSARRSAPTSPTIDAAASPIAYPCWKRCWNPTWTHATGRARSARRSRGTRRP